MVGVSSCMLRVGSPVSNGKVPMGLGAGRWLMGHSGWKKYTGKCNNSCGGAERHCLC